MRDATREWISGFGIQAVRGLVFDITLKGVRRWVVENGDGDTPSLPNEARQESAGKCAYVRLFADNGKFLSFRTGSEPD